MTDRSAETTRSDAFVAEISKSRAVGEFPPFFESKAIGPRSAIARTIKPTAQSVAGRQQLNGSVARLLQRSDGRAQHDTGLVDSAALDDDGYRINAIRHELGIRHIEGEGSAYPLAQLH